MQWRNRTSKNRVGISIYNDYIMIQEIKSGVAYEAIDVEFVAGDDYCNPCNNMCD